jgi:hypothetical protein
MRPTDDSNAIRRDNFVPEHRLIKGVERITGNIILRSFNRVQSISLCFAGSIEPGIRVAGSMDQPPVNLHESTGLSLT